ncbi:MAG: hypothetical protein AAF614_09495 [Chloroflexota bacterium]
MTKKEFILSAVLGVFLFAVLARVNLSVGIDTLYAQTALSGTFQTDSDEDDTASSDGDIGGILSNLQPDNFDFSFFLELLFPDNFKRDGNGIDLLITIPDFDFSMGFQASNSEDEASNSAIAFDGQVAFTVEESMIFTMQVSDPIPLPLSLVFEHRIENGLLQFDVVSGELGPFDMPEGFAANIGDLVNDICVGILDQGFSNFSVRNVHFDDGAMTITIRRLQ